MSLLSSTLIDQIKSFIMKILTTITASALLVFFTLSCQQSSQTGDGATSQPTDYAKGQSTVDDGDSEANILKIALGSESHSTLVAAVQAASIEDILVNTGPITLFAPTNAAFEKLPAGTVEDLLKPENKEALKNILYYHAAPGTYKDALLKDGRKLGVANDGSIEIKKDGDDVYVNGSKILATIDASNGVIHVIEDVLLPPN